MCSASGKKRLSPTVEDYGVMAHKDCTVCARHFDNDGNEIKDLRIAKIGTHKVIVNGESKFYAHGESVTVTAEDKERQRVQRLEGRKRKNRQRRKELYIYRKRRNNSYGCV